MRSVQIELSVQGCQEALKQLEEYQKSIKPKMLEVCKRLAEIGAMAAQAHMGGANEGNADAFIMPIEPIDNGYKIVMSGSDVYFVEFGTGDYVDRHFDNTSVPIFSGSWSMEHAQQYVTNLYWYFGGVRYEGTEAYMPMYYASRAIRDNIKRVASEVFRQ